ncbi:response regulator transcription factor [Cohnella fermenti]|uniref:Response regulator n=1 Tax=Cohnella fermenti TaxID=2565925 RepID=A0A4S4BS99_9BACL|nr:response regulator [Cohnella fermenti]THF77739.1 response regulator [Cohnella fermenti]
MRGRLFIVDDEPMIRKGLTKLVESNPLGWSVVGEAANGEEALDQLRELQPNLVITDIRMPVMDGIELAKRLAEQAPRTAVVMLTGYRDFEYAQAAVNYGVKQFLLKPCPEEEVCRVLQAAFEQYRLQEASKEREAEERSRREDQLLRSVWKRLPYAAEEARELERALTGKELWLVQVETYYPEAKDYQGGDLKLLQFAVGNILQELAEGVSGASGAPGEGEDRRLMLEYDSFVFFLSPEGDSESLFEEASSVVKRLLGLELAVRRYGPFRGFKHTEAWMDAALLDHSREGDQGAGPGEAMEDQTIGGDKVRLIRSELTALLLLGRPAELEAYLRRVLDSALQISAHADAMKIEAFCAAMAMDDVMRKELEADPRTVGDIGQRVAELHRTRTREEVKAWLQGQIRTFEQALLSWHMERSGGIVQRAILYIEEHYAEECALPTVAAHTHLSPNYFGSLFKKETGESFSGYVLRFRTEKAKLLLKNTNKKVAEIGQAVGFPGSNYFATVFKQMTGLSPTDYRKQGQSWRREEHPQG